MTAKVTVDDKGVITALEVTGDGETPSVGGAAIEPMTEDILAAGNTEVDTISGATLTSYGVVNAVADAVSQAGADIDALRKVAVEKEVPAAEDMTTQVVVAGGGFATVDSQVIEAQGADDSLERTMNYFKMVNETSERQPDYDFVEYLMGEIGVTIDYMVNDLGLEATYSDRGDYIRTNFADGAGTVKLLAKVLEDEGVTVLVNSEVTDIVMEDGKAAGVKVTGEGGDFTVNADKVILATGGASWDHDRQFHVLGEDDQPIENLFAVGETATSTLFGDYYFGGFSLGYYSAAGRIAGQTAAAEVLGSN